MRRLTLAVLMLAACAAATGRVITGDERTELYVPSLEGKRVAIYTNHTGMAGDRHVVDLLRELGLHITAIFAPEHGFRGNADAGESVESAIDEKTGIPVISLYGPGLKNIDSYTRDTLDVLLVDIQDVGLRFYTYYVTMWRLMNSCAKWKKKVVVLDRPNPNGFYVDGPVLDMRFRSGVGWLPIPIVYGMTLGELAQMICGEGWLDGGARCDLSIVPCKHYRRTTRAKLTIAPSPNLPTMKAIYLYPSMCFFEGTVVSLGRGTSKPFQVYGHPQMRGHGYYFTPRSMRGAKHSPLEGKLCHGRDLSSVSDASICRRGIDLSYVVDAYRDLGMGSAFFTPFFDKLAGCSYIREMIIDGASPEEIRARWRGDVSQFIKKRKPYLIY